MQKEHVVSSFCLWWTSGGNIIFFQKFPLNNVLHNYGLHVTLDEMLHIDLNGLYLSLRSNKILDLANIVFCRRQLFYTGEYKQTTYSAVAKFV